MQFMQVVGFLVTIKSQDGPLEQTNCKCSAESNFKKVELKPTSSLISNTEVDNIFNNFMAPLLISMNYKIK